MKIILLLLLMASGSIAQALSTTSREVKLMGVSFAFTAVHENPETARAAIDKSIAEVQRIERLISSWDPNSQTSSINKNAGLQPVKVDRELFQLIQRSMKISQITNGYFDISFASIDKVWTFGDYQTETLPSREEIQFSVDKIGYEHIVLDTANHTVFLKIPGMKIGFGAIGKGYAANRVKAIMLEMGIQSGVVNAGGDLLNWGTKPDGTSWNVGIADPQVKSNVMSWLNISDMAVVTSGNYEKFITIDGKRYCHIINPKTGWPVDALSSVTIICKDAELADALATSVFVLGKEDGLKLINHLNGVECMIIDMENNTYFSNNITPSKPAE